MNGENLQKGVFGHPKSISEIDLSPPLPKEVTGEHNLNLRTVYVRLHKEISGQGFLGMLNSFLNPRAEKLLRVLRDRLTHTHTR